MGVPSQLDNLRKACADGNVEACRMLREQTPLEYRGMKMAHYDDDQVVNGCRIDVSWSHNDIPMKVIDHQTRTIKDLDGYGTTDRVFTVYQLTADYDLACSAISGLDPVWLKSGDTLSVQGNYSD